MTRFLLVLAVITAYSSAYSQKIKFILDGMKKTYYDNGKPCVEYQYVLGGYHGEHKTYYSNGNVSKQGTCNLGERHGVREIYDEDGSLSSSENFVMGTRQAKAELIVKAQRQSNSSLMEV